MVQGLRMVDKGILGSDEDIFKPLEFIKPGIIALGNNQFFKEEELEAQLRAHGIGAKVARIRDFKECELCSSAAIIKRVLERNKGK